MGGDPIAGQVDLDLVKPESIQSVIFWVKGAVTTPGSKSRNFFEHNDILWDTSMGDPRNVTPGTKFDGKLSGQYTLPFSVIIPEGVQDRKVLKALGLNEHQKLPPTISEKGGCSIVGYEVGVTVKRSDGFQRNNILYTSVHYTPRSKPDQPSSLRQRAYGENTQLLDPSIDPQGWSPFRLFNCYVPNVTCTLALATPACYTRGSVIPCFLTLESTDLQTLDILSNPEVHVVRIGRRINTKPASEVAKMSGEAMILSNTPLGYACWWPPLGEQSVASHIRTLQGEIKLSPHLVPSFTFGHFSLKYYLELLPPQLPGFIPTKGKYIIRTNIEIATDYPDGPRPRVYLPPEYDILRPELTAGDAEREPLGPGFMYS
ncbi:hypothetical protein BD410DRAFT_791582 [Rickenella mellea]|uniref:Arrestin-like N-terminal domain-containing protein n=1 Tax=Rickenella mellea TaxID=50990 RepID=A0A4Y7PYH1_9AGAM|nr:hypothetical protein BD410DRAFT_791582 [Rickenella mellea]